MTIDKIVIHRWPGLAAGPLLLGEHRPHLILPTQPVHPIRTYLVSSGTQLVIQEPISELGVIGVTIDQSVRQISIVPIRIRIRSGTPPI